ncbi:hypothetical protein ANCDUO_02513 [Ancylostoma duodenale]|uniref:Uncharacterized protein n=1 Tax=Ancylostoma duodenale TaxID=51022 RepID=A0A0C2DW62_9BILA|nr:hypothetical protein ANCDUO_02513 [Ancylostoma duodenale]
MVITGTLCTMCAKWTDLIEADVCPIGIDGLLPTLRQIVDALASERWGLALEELLEYRFDVVVSLEVFTIQMTLKMGKKVVIRGSEV